MDDYYDYYDYYDWDDTEFWDDRGELDDDWND